MKKHANLSIFIPHEGCTNGCIFCDQRIISGQQKAPLVEEVKEYCNRYLTDDFSDIDTKIAFFGGSFTAIEREYMISLLEVASSFVKDGRAEGIRISTRPDAISYEILDILKEYGVTAIELGAQSMNDEVLKANKRGHTIEDTYQASEKIKEYKFSLGLQMMIGMYGEKDPKEEAIATAKHFIKIAPDTVRIYPTVVLADTELEQLFSEGKYKVISVDKAAVLVANLFTMFESRGIKVIRIGLHSDVGLAKSIIAGPFHPSFGEMVRSYIMREKLEEVLKDKEHGTYIVYVSPNDISSMVGLKKMNKYFFSNLGYPFRVKANEELKRGEIYAYMDNAMF